MTSTSEAQTRMPLYTDNPSNPTPLAAVEPASIDPGTSAVYEHQSPMIPRTILLCLVLAIAGACGGKSTGGAVEYSVSAQHNYEKGMQALTDKDWLAAAKYFSFIKSRFPYSKYAVLSELRLA